MSNFEKVVESWSLSGDPRAMRELEPYVEQARERGEFAKCSCWRGDSTQGHACATKPGNVLAYGRCTSWSVHRYGASQFAEFAADEHGGTEVIYHVDNASMFDVSRYSKLGTEGEVISSKDAEFEVMSCEYDDIDNRYYVDLKQIR